MSRNVEIATILHEFADRLEATGVEYKPRAYRRAADNIASYPVDIEDLAEDGIEGVKQIDGVGKAIAEKTVEYLETGSISELDDLREELPVAIEELTRVEGIGPKSIGALYDALDIRTLEDLEAAAQSGSIRTVEGFGAKTEENILANIPFAKQVGSRSLLGDARPLADDVLAYLADMSAVSKCEVAGSIRRWRETIGDIDILVGTEAPQSLMDAILEWERVESVIESGENKGSVRIAGFRVDFRFITPDEFGSALQYFTGNKDHNVRLRNRAIDRGLRMNEYGVFDVSGIEVIEGRRPGTRIAGATEESMYEALDLPWIPPEIREDLGEIDAAEKGMLPSLIDPNAVRGDLHVHTDWSDGVATLSEIVAAAADFGHEYVAITDHAIGPGVVGGVGLDEERLLEQRDEIERLNDTAPITVFSGVEVNIDGTGGVVIAEDVLDELDLVIASPHSQLDMDPSQATDRLINAISHPAVDVLGHPTGRLLNRRAGLELDLERIIEAAVQNETVLEVNSNPHRLDLWGRAIKLAIAAGASIAINTDTHRPSEFNLLRYGVHTARRGWAETDDVLNTGSAERVGSWLGAHN